MISYDVAKELKDAGFALKRAADWNVTECPFPWGQVTIHNDIYLLPTLSELIEACGKGFDCLAQRNYQQCWGAIGNVGARQIDERGSTPEQAVAMLWLALNKKDAQENTPTA